MVNSLLVSSCIFSLIFFGNCNPNKWQKIQKGLKFNRKLGLHISTITSIQAYEHEHQMMYRNVDGTIDEAKYLQRQSELASKHPTMYCHKYLKAVVPKRGITGLHGEPDIVQLVYLYKEMDGREIVAIRCDLPINELRWSPLSYYIADAPHHCAYTIMRIGRKSSPFRIISQVCNFENDNSPDFKYSRNNLKNETGGISRTHKTTGTPIACDDLIEKYEYQHQEMHRKKDGTINDEMYWTWPKNKEENYLSAVCSHYLKAIVPIRAKEINDVSAIVKKSFIIYNLKNRGFKKFISMIHCQLPRNKYRCNKINYYITEAPDSNCVFTLLRPARRLVFKIVFHVCGFIGGKDVSENDVDVTIGIQSVNLNIPKEEAQEKCENKPDLKSLQLLPEN